MAISDTAVPFGLRDLKIRVLDNTDTPGASVDLPAARKLTFAEAQDSQELRGDDGIFAVHGIGASVNWSLEAGGTNFEAVKAMVGGTISETGVSPNVVRTFYKTDQDQRPYFEAEGQSISDSGGDFHCTLHKCKATGELGGEQSDGAFQMTTLSGKAFGRSTDRRVYTWTQNETETAIA